MQRLKSAGTVLFDFDRVLMADLMEWVTSVNRGLDQMEKLKAAKNIPDQIALNAIAQEVSFLLYGHGLQDVFKKLVAHCKSWGRVDDQVCREPQYAAALNDLRQKLQKHRRSLAEKASGE